MKMHRQQHDGRFEAGRARAGGGIIGGQLLQRPEQVEERRCHQGDQDEYGRNHAGVVPEGQVDGEAEEGQSQQGKAARCRPRLGHEGAAAGKEEIAQAREVVADDADGAVAGGDHQHGQHEDQRGDQGIHQDGFLEGRTLPGAKGQELAESEQEHGRTEHDSAERLLAHHRRRDEVDTEQKQQSQPGDGAQPGLIHLVDRKDGLAAEVELVLDQQPATKNEAAAFLVDQSPARGELGIANVDRVAVVTLVAGQAQARSCEMARQGRLALVRIQQLQRSPSVLVRGRQAEGDRMAALVQLAREQAHGAARFQADGVGEFGAVQMYLRIVGGQPPMAAMAQDGGLAEQLARAAWQARQQQTPTEGQVTRNVVTVGKPNQAPQHRFRKAGTKIPALETEYRDAAMDAQQQDLVVLVAVAGRRETDALDALRHQALGAQRQPVDGDHVGRARIQLGEVAGNAAASSGEGDLRQSGRELFAILEAVVEAHVVAAHIAADGEGLPVGGQRHPVAVDRHLVRRHLADAGGEPRQNQQQRGRGQAQEPAIGVGAQVAAMPDHMAGDRQVGEERQVDEQVVQHADTRIKR